MVKNRYVAPLLVVSMLFALAVAPLATAAESLVERIAVMSVQEVLERSSVAREARRQLESEFEQHRSSLQSEQAELEKLQDEIEKRSSVWSEQARAEKEQEFNQRLSALERRGEEAQRAIQQLEQRLMEPILIELNEVIADMGQENDYALILEYTMKGLDSRTGILYADEALDISQQMGEELDRRLAE